MGGTSRLSPPALPQDAQLLVGQKEEAPALAAPGSRGGSWKGRGQSRFPFPRSLPDVSYSSINSSILGHLLYSRHSERVSHSQQPYETLILWTRNPGVREGKSFAQDRTASEWRNWNFEQRRLSRTLCLLPPIPPGQAG